MKPAVLFVRRLYKTFGKLSLGLLVTLWMPGLSVIANAQGGHFFAFDAPGADITPGDFSGTLATGINISGTITGYYQGTDTVFHGFVRSPAGKFTSFEAPGADTTAGSFNGTTPSAINDLGVTTGSYTDTNGFNHGFVRSPDGKIASFDVDGVGGFGSFPIAINLEGAIAGYYTDANFSFRAFLRSPDGTFSTWIGPNACTDSGANGCFGSGASNINALGIVVGGFEDNGGNFVHHSFVRSRNGQLNVFDIPGAGTGAYQGTGCPGCALGFNQLGAVAGIYSDDNYVNHGFVRAANGKITTFDVAGAGTDPGEGTGCFSDCPTSINDLGAVMGTYIDGNFVFHGYYRKPNGRIETVDPPGTISTGASGMNNAGFIAGFYQDGNGTFHGFLRTP